MSINCACCDEYCAKLKFAGDIIFQYISAIQPYADNVYAYIIFCCLETIIFCCLETIRHGYKALLLQKLLKWRHISKKNDQFRFVYLHILGKFQCAVSNFTVKIHRDCTEIMLKYRTRY